jgi:glycosyltransferase involved in cell wall biosynthesis
MMRVAVVIDSLKVGGAQRLVAAYASNAAAHDITPLIISLHRESAPVITDAIRSAGIEIVTLPATSLFSVRRFRQLVQLLEDRKIEIVQTHLIYSNILGSAAARVAGVPVIATLHSTHVRGGWKSKQLKRVEDLVLRQFATRILAVGNMVEAANKTRYGGRKLDVIPNGIQMPGPVQPESREQLRRELGSNVSDPIIITVGRFSQAKGYEDMIKAFSLLRDHGKKPVLLMVGSGNQAESIQAQVDSLNLHESVILAGERQDVPQLLAASDVFASSSHREGLPLAVLEAMMAGLPVVATSVGDIPNVVTEETGVIVPPHQPEQLAAAIEKLLDDPEQRQLMGRAARQRAIHEYSVDAWMKRHVALYEELLSSKRQGTSP